MKQNRLLNQTEKALHMKPDLSNCRLRPGRNETGPEWKAGWKSIHLNIVINSLLFLSILTVYIILRRRARQLDRKRRRSIGWLQFIYGDRFPANRPAFVTRHNVHHKHEHNSRLLLPPAVSKRQTASVLDDVNMSTPYVGRSEVLDSGGDHESGCHPCFCLKDCFSKSVYRILRLIRVTDAELEAKRGTDAVQYMLFQRYLIVYMLILCTVCTAIILPVNMSGSIHGVNGKYDRTTIMNIDIEKESNLLWFHAVCSVMMLPIAIVMMSHFNSAMKARSESEAERTLFIRHIPKQHVDKELLIRFFNQQFPGTSVEGVQLVYSIKYLRRLHMKLMNAQNAIQEIWQYVTYNNCKYEMRPYFLGHFGGLCCCCCCCEKVDGMLYFREQEMLLEKMLAKEFKRTISNPTGSVFITFETAQMASDVNNFFNTRAKRVLKQIPLLNLVVPPDEYKSRTWLVSFAPHPEDVNWFDVTASNKQKWLRRALVYFFILVVFLFLSTPSIALSYLQSSVLNQTVRKMTKESPIVSEYLYPLMLVVTGSILPALVMWISSYLPYERQSGLDHATMWNVFMFNLFMVLVLPSLGLTSARQLVEEFANNPFRWQCAFPVDNGAVFINYVIQSAFIGTASEMMHFSELVMYFYYGIFYTYSAAEYENMKQEITFDFYFGTRYPKFLLMFCIVGTYCMTCPLIAPAGLMFMCLKHLVDKYNLFYVYEPIKISDDIHDTAITFFYIGVWFMQLEVFLVIFLRTGYSDVTGFMILSLLISTMIFMMKCCCGCLPNCIPSTLFLRRKPVPKSKKDFCACLYLPPVLYQLNSLSKHTHRVMSSSSGKVE